MESNSPTWREVQAARHEKFEATQAERYAGADHETRADLDAWYGQDA